MMTKPVERLERSLALQRAVRAALEKKGKGAGQPDLPPSSVASPSVLTLEGRFPVEQVDFILTGTPISPGLGIGEAVLYLEPETVLHVPREKISRSEIESEKKDFLQAISGAKEKIETEKQAGDIERELLDILDVHWQILSDPALIQTGLNFIRGQRLKAAAALAKSLEEKDDELRLLTVNDSTGIIARIRLELRHVKTRLMREMGLTKGSDLATLLKKQPADELIVVADSLSPSDIIAMKKVNGRIKGLVVREGGTDSHLAILARAMGLPVVADIADPLRQIDAGSLLVVDARIGAVICNAAPEKIEQMRQEETAYETWLTKIINQVKGQPCQTSDGVRIKIMGNIGFAWELPQITKFEGGGVGLYRSEMAFYEGDGLPSEFRQKCLHEGLGPAVVRVFDLGGDKDLPLEIKLMLGDDQKTEPLFLHQKLRTVFKTQLRAILQASPENQQLCFMFPMISTRAQLVEALTVVAAVKQELAEAGISYNNNIKIGMMVETRQAVNDLGVLSEVCVLGEKIAFLSLGTNDLTADILGVNRTDAYDPFNLEVLQAIAQTVTVAKEKNLGLCVCGNLAADPTGIKFLIGLGVTQLSVPPREIPIVKHCVINTSHVDAEEFAQKLISPTNLLLLNV